MIRKESSGARQAERAVACLAGVASREIAIGKFRDFAQRDRAPKWRAIGRPRASRPRTITKCWKIGHLDRSRQVDAAVLEVASSHSVLVQFSGYGFRVQPAKLIGR